MDNNLLGRVLYFKPEEMTILVVMQNEMGIRYIDPENLEFNDDGSLKTEYVEMDAVVVEGCQILDTLGNVSRLYSETVRIVTTRKHYDEKISDIMDAYHNSSES